MRHRPAVAESWPLAARPLAAATLLLMRLSAVLAAGPMEALAWQPAAPAAGKEVKWAKGLTRNARGDLWCMAFQVGMAPPLS